LIISSPSGCTFWGKKPWSRKKKILWQMGTLIGAPLGIALAAGVVLPAMVIGIPVYVGRQVRIYCHLFSLFNGQECHMAQDAITCSIFGQFV